MRRDGPPRTRLAALAAGAFALPARCSLPVTAEAAPSATVCDTSCDGRDPALAPQTRTPAMATLFSRSIALRFADADADAMGWAPTDNGSPGDEVWLGRSCDGGRAWSSGEPPR